MKHSNRERAHYTALRLLTRREHSKRELEQKLAQRNFTPDDIQSIVENLINTGLQSDARFAESFTRYRQNKGQGPLRIRLELKARGISDEIIEEVVNITDNAWFMLVRKAWQRHFKGRLPLTPPERAKQTRFLYQRGFTTDHINSLTKDDHEHKNPYSD